MATDLVITSAGSQGPRLLFVEPYATHSHRAFARGALAHIPARWTLLELPGRYFRWRMRGAAAFLAAGARQVLEGDWDGLVGSSMLGLAELRGLVPSLSRVPATVVFHENQLDYPAPGRATGGQRERDLYLAFSNLTSAACARRVVFNSGCHMRHFLDAARKLLQSLPDMHPQGLVEAIEARSRALPIPLDVSLAPAPAQRPPGPLRLVWNHRWEHDKDPERLFRALATLAREGAAFQVAVMGPRPASWPRVFDEAPELLGQRLVHLGPVDDRAAYWRRLAWADVVISTAKQEYFGLSVAEGAWAGCMPLVPDALVYPELYPAQCRYGPGGLLPALRALAAAPDQVRQGDWHALAAHLTWQEQAPAWSACIMED